jgi:hypothetical protein
VENGALEASGAQFWFSYDGPIVRILGLVDAALGDLTLAEKELREALSLAVERRHPPLEAQIVYELAKVLRKIGGREEEAAALVERCSEIARRLGMTGLAGNVEAAVLEADRVVELAREGDVWRVRRGKTLVRVKHSRGLELLARLVERPGEEVHVLALGSDEPAANVVESDAGEVLDERARKAYRQRIVDLDEDLADAERCSDVGRIEKLRRERIALDAELKRAVGLGGRSRRDGSATERARVNVQRRMKDAIARIGEVDADLGRFFERAVSTGTFCCFRP